ncbi:MAG: IgGFc-binding protein [Myxococcales bacterium]
MRRASGLLLLVLLLPGCDAGGGTGTLDAGSGPGRRDGGAGGGGDSCIPGEVKSCTEDSKALICNAEGNGFVERGCPVGTYCDGTSCLPQACTPGALTCRDGQTALLCDSRGTTWEKTIACDASRQESCVNGECVTECELARRKSSYIGCEYYAVHLDNVDGSGSIAAASDQPITLVASNTSTTQAEFTVYNPTCGAVAACTAVKVPPKGTAQCSIKDLVRPSGVMNKAYRLVSNRPLTVYQFNPLNNVNVYSNDGSLLLPVHVAAQQYYALTWKQVSTAPAQVVIVAVEEGTTSVTVNSTTSIAAGTGFAALSAGQSRTVELQRGQLLSLSTGGAGSDLTGTFIEATRPVLVFGAHRCANVGVVNGSPASYCDHVEEQLFPIATWGKVFVAARSADRPQSGTNVPDTFRVLASSDNTQLTTNPPLPGFPVTLQKGKWHEFESNKDFELTATQPVSVAQFLPGSTYQNPNASTVHIGDPSMMLIPPTEQFRPDYVVVTPKSYTANFINIVQPADADVRIDGVGLPAGVCQAVGTTSLQACRVPVVEGTHVIQAKKPVGVILYGYAQDVSYGYVGGLDLKKIAGGFK